jgi:hypothetical protein
MQPQKPKRTDDTLPEAAKYLQLAFGFTAHDLFCNQAGYMSKEQRAFLRKYDIQQAIGAALVVVILAGLVALTFVSVMQEFGTAPFLNSVMALVSMIGFGLLLVVLVREIWIRWSARLHDLRTGAVAQVDGDITLETARASRGGALYCRVRIGRETLTAPEVALRKLHDGEHLRIYYAPASKIVLSAEPLAP